MPCDPAFWVQIPPGAGLFEHYIYAVVQLWWPTTQTNQIRIRCCKMGPALPSNLLQEILSKATLDYGCETIFLTKLVVG